MIFPRYFRLIQSWFPSNNWLVKLSLFHDKRGPVWATLKILTDTLKRHNINYAVVGGVAVHIHGYERLTNDCDILLAKADVKCFEENIVGTYVKPKFKGAKRKFVCNETKCPIDIIIEGEYPGKGEEVPVAFPSPRTSSQLIDGMWVITLVKLIELKLSSYKSLPGHRVKDKADVVELIVANNLKKPFADLLHPYVRSDYKDIIDLMEKEKLEIK
ncbi:uncharacterized protein LOC119073639 [Bradysia coprophila]|uniref:uncharacterized protein LOC119073639 n=1 Tax=Bradysia coprophila TaxID=38358 RepID=UPI00187D73DC|nr:uncharacterized protein LOC119073639 [Bradysia coprophila]